ncbi:hypothetical protein [Pedobacter sp. UBA5917]|jgi:hypothetical protein|uniref:hypothetical protein n=1 Tax=Pedobacter sp. UBA5917 TaxID=1947061 RepID=UPI0025EC392B|nr:hypothetical protein [Pedobacter sp. UBA5917]
MNKKSLLSGSVILLISLIIFSCRREISDFVGDQSSVSTAALENAKIFYQSHATMTEELYQQYERKTLKLRKRPNRKNFIRLRPLWHAAKSFDLSSGQLIVVPTYEKQISSKKVNVRRFFVFHASGNSVKDGEIIEIVGMDYNLKDKLDQILPALGQQRMIDFTGAVLEYDLNYYYKKSRLYKNGQISSLNGKFTGMDPKLASSRGPIGTGTSTAFGGDTSGGGDTGGQTSISHSGPCTIVYWYTWQVDPQGNIFNENYQFLYFEGDCSGPSTPGGNTGGNSGGDTDPTNTGGVGTTTGDSTGGSGGYGGNTDPAPQNDFQFLHNIDSEKLKPCFKTMLEAATDINGAGVTAAIRSFTMETPGFNWVLKDGTLSEGTNGQTQLYDRTAKSVTTTFDSEKFKNASDLAIMRTILHEAAHAYLVTYFANDTQHANEEYVYLFERYTSAKHGDLNDEHHNQFTRSFVLDIAVTLREYGDTKGYTFSSNFAKEMFYGDLAWGGLTDTDAFLKLPLNERTRIKNTLNSEQYGKDSSGNDMPHKGNSGGC